MHAHERFNALRETIREEIRYKREAVREHFHPALHDVEAKVLAHVHQLEADLYMDDWRKTVAAIHEKLAAIEGHVHRLAVHNGLATHDAETRLEKVESRMHVAETRLDAHAEAIAPGGHDGHLMTHVESRLEKVERDTLPTRVGTGVAPAAAKYPGEGEAWRPTAGGAQG